MGHPPCQGGSQKGYNPVRWADLGRIC